MCIRDRSVQQRNTHSSSSSSSSSSTRIVTSSCRLGACRTSPSVANRTHPVTRGNILCSNRNQICRVNTGEYKVLGSIRGFRLLYGAPAKQYPEQSGLQGVADAPSQLFDIFCTLHSRKRYHTNFNSSWSYSNSNVIVEYSSIAKNKSL